MHKPSFLSFVQSLQYQSQEWVVNVLTLRVMSGLSLVLYKESRKAVGRRRLCAALLRASFVFISTAAGGQGQVPAPGAERFVTSGGPHIRPLGYTAAEPDYAPSLHEPTLCRAVSQTGR